MAVGGVKGGGGKGGKAGGGKAGPAARGDSHKRVEAIDREEANRSLVGPSPAAGAEGVTGTSNQGAGSDVPLTRDFCAQIARSIPDRHEQVKALVAEILSKTLRIQSKALTERIAEELLQDQNCKPKLERLLSKG